MTFVSRTSPVRLGVVGARRGLAHIRTTELLADLVHLSAVCDNNPQMLREWGGSNVRLYREYEELLADREIDAICLATPLPLHCAQAIQALEAGKHVICEVTAAWTLEECAALREAVERSGLTYMMAENCCFFRENMMIGRMVELGLFGELITAEGSYLHDCSKLNFYNAEELTWRGKLRQEEVCNWYPTHSLGPVCQWLGINKTDRLKSAATWGSRAVAVADYARRNFGEASPYAAEDAWRMPDSMMTLIRTEKGVLIEHRLDTSSPRPRPQNRYALQGTNASFVWNPDFDDAPRIWIRDRSPTSEIGLAMEWESLWKYTDEWEHPDWKAHGDKARQCGHLGADFFVLREFALAIQERRAPSIDVYDAVTWSCIAPISAISLKCGGGPVDVPYFARAK